MPAQKDVTLLFDQYLHISGPWRIDLFRNVSRKGKKWENPPPQVKKLMTKRENRRYGELLNIGAQIYRQYIPKFKLM